MVHAEVTLLNIIMTETQEGANNLFMRDAGAMETDSVRVKNANIFVLYMKKLNLILPVQVKINRVSAL